MMIRYASPGCGDQCPHVSGAALPDSSERDCCYPECSPRRTLQIRTWAGSWVPIRHWRPVLMGHLRSLSSRLNPLGDLRERVEAIERRNAEADASAAQARAGLASIVTSGLANVLPAPMRAIFASVAGVDLASTSGGFAVSTPNHTDFVFLVIKGKPREEQDRLALALDVAILFGAICAVKGEGGFKGLSAEQLEKLYRDKLARLEKLSDAVPL